MYVNFNIVSIIGNFRYITVTCAIHMHWKWTAFELEMKQCNEILKVSHLLHRHDVCAFAPWTEEIHTWKSENIFFICFLDARAFPSASSAHICLMLTRRLLPIATINHNEKCDGKECQLCNDTKMYRELLSPTRQISAQHTYITKYGRKAKKTQRKAIWIQFIIHDAVYS